MRRSVAILSIVTLAACSSRAHNTTPPARQTSAPKTTPTLLDHVPHDTPFLFAQKGSSFAGAKLHDMLADMRKELEPALAMVDDKVLAEAKPHERLLFVAMRALVALGNDDWARLGFDPTRIEFAVYGWGLTPVMRLRLDGVFLRGLVARSFADAGIDDPAVPWGKHQYRTFTFDSGIQLIGVVLDDQLVMAVSRRAEAILPHLVGDDAGRPARAFELDSINARYPQLQGTPFMLFDPARTAALVEKGDALRALAPELPRGCAPAIAQIVRTLPGMAGTVSEPDRKTRRSRVIIGPSPTMAKTVNGLIRPVPRWPGDPGHGIAYYGLGLAPLPTLEALADYVDDAFSTAHACGGTPPKESARDALRSIAPLLAPMNGMTIVFHAPPPDNEEAIQVEMFADVTDPYAVYKWLSSLASLPPRPPAFGTAIELPFGDMEAALVLEPNGIAASFGPAGSSAALDKLRRAPAGPRILAKIAIGTGVADESPNSTTFMEMNVEGDALVIDSVERAK